MRVFVAFLACTALVRFASAASMPLDASPPGVLFSGKDFRVMSVKRLPGSKRPVMRFSEEEVLAMALTSVVYSDDKWEEGEIRLFPPGTRIPPDTYLGKKPGRFLMFRARAPKDPDQRVRAILTTPLVNSSLAKTGPGGIEVLHSGKRIVVSLLTLRGLVENRPSGAGARFLLGLKGRTRIVAGKNTAELQSGHLLRAGAVKGPTVLLTPVGVSSALLLIDIKP